MKIDSKFGFALIIVIFFSSFLSNAIFAQEEDIQDHHHLTEVLGEQNKENFFVIDESLASNRINLSMLQQSNNNILIPAGVEVVINGEATPDFSTILVEGTLNVIKTEDVPLKVQKIIISPSGSLTIGTETNPVGSAAEIIFEKKETGEIGIFVFGDLTIHGNTVQPTFLELTSNAEPGQTQIVVSESMNGWNSGDSVLITSPGIKENIKECTEEAEILKTEGTFVILKEPLSCYHPGRFLDNDDVPNSHVVLLTRNIKFESADPKNRGSVNYFFGSSGYIKYAQFETMGPKNVMGRYPIHFHLMFDTSRGIEVVGNSIIDSENRWITVHRSNGIIIKDNIGYKSVGHGFFLEDGIEFENVFEHNIGIKTFKGKLIPSDKASAIFWITNPVNSFRNNVAVEGNYYGFHFSIPNLNVDLPTIENVHLRSLPNTEFDQNITYDNRHAGIRIDRETVHDTRINSPEIVISNAQIWALDASLKPNEGIIINGDYIKISDSTIHDFPIGISLNGDSITIDNNQITYYNTEKKIPPLSGIVITGEDNLITGSKIQGYVSKNEIAASDISLSNDIFREDITSASIVDTTLSDPVPIIFGYPRNIESFIEVSGYDAPNGPDDLPSNFVLKRGDHNILKGNADQGIFNPTFLALVERSSNTSIISNEESDLREIQIESERRNALILQSLKNKAELWKDGSISNQEFLAELIFLQESKMIYLSNVETDDFEQEFVVPSWTKNLIGFWLDNLIDDDEFLVALQYILEQQIGFESSVY